MLDLYHATRDELIRIIRDQRDGRYRGGRLENFAGPIGSLG
jgi:hypothetical protein